MHFYVSCRLGFSHQNLLYKLKFIGVGRQYLSIVLEFVSDNSQRMRVDSMLIVYASITTIYTAIPILISHPQVIESLNYDLTEKP